MFVYHVHVCDLQRSEKDMDLQELKLQKVISRHVGSGIESGSLQEQCGSLNVIVSHNVLGSGTIRNCGFVGVGVVLLEEVYHCGSVF